MASLSAQLSAVRRAWTRELATLFPRGVPAWFIPDLCEHIGYDKRLGSSECVLLANFASESYEGEPIAHEQRVTIYGHGEAEEVCPFCGVETLQRDGRCLECGLTLSLEVELSRWRARYQATQAWLF
jgi:hypothetical protein